MFRNLKIVFVLIAILILSLAAYAFTAAITGIPQTRAGSGSETVSGYAVSNFAYNFNATDPAVLDSVTFTLDAAAANVQVLLDAGGSWITCTNVVNDWTCVANMNVVDIDIISIVASSN